MKRILIFSDQDDIDRQVLQPTNYSSLWNGLVKQGGGNSGNKLFIFAIEKYLTKPDILIAHYCKTMTADYINHNYDLIVLPMANILNPNPKVQEEMNFYAYFFSKIKIPVYPIGAGVQADSYKDKNRICNCIRESAAGFIKSIYNTGGEFALRGYFTKEVFENLGFHEGVVTGCPSMYQNGRNLYVNKKNINKQDFSFLLNGDILYLQQKKLQRLIESNNSTFMDQNEFAELLYSHDLNVEDLYKHLYMLKLIKKYTVSGLKKLCANKVKLVYDIPVWINILKKGNYSFSFGSRIHGNFAAILSGIPAMVLYRDSRTRELAEFFNIPSIENLPADQDLYSLYNSVSYNKFNNEFSSKFDSFQKFLSDHNIVDDISDDSYFLKKYSQINYQEPLIQNLLFLDELDTKLSFNISYKLYDKLFYHLRTIKAHIKKENSFG